MAHKDVFFRSFSHCNNHIQSQEATIAATVHRGATRYSCDLLSGVMLPSLWAANVVDSDMFMTKLLTLVMNICYTQHTRALTSHIEYKQRRIDEAEGRGLHTRIYSQASR